VYSPIFCYLQQHDWQVGSAHKYFTLLMNRYGGITLRSRRNVAVIQDWKADVQRLKPALIFCRGDWLKYYQLPLMYDIPYILIEQDVHSLRSKLLQRQLEIEREMCEKAAGVIFTSEDHLDYLQNEMHYKMPNVGVVHLRPLKQMLAWHPKKKLVYDEDDPNEKHLVYAGGIVKTGGGNYGYRNYQSIFEAFVEAGWTVHVYGSKNQYATVRAMGKLDGVVPHGWIPYEDLLCEMSQYTAGLQAYAQENVNTRQFAYTQSCRPNKTWDYLAAGIPTIGLYAGNCAKIYVEGGWGVTIPDTKRSTLEKIQLPSFPPGLRFEQVMENDLSILEEVIATAIRNEKAKPITIEEKKGEENNMASAKHLWHRLDKPVIEDGRLLYGRGKRIPMKEAIRLGLVKKEVVVKEKLQKRVEKKKKAAKKKEKKATPKKKVTKVETKPLLAEKAPGSFKEAFNKDDKKEEVESLTTTLKLLEKKEE